MPKESTRQKGGKGQEEHGWLSHKQRFLQESWRGTLWQQAQHTVCRHEPLLRMLLSKAASQTKRFCLPLHTKPHISLTDLSGKLLSLGTGSSTKVGDVFLCHLDFAWQ